MVVALSGQKGVFMASGGDILNIVAGFSLLGQTVLNVYDMFVGDDAPDSELLQDIELQLSAAYNELDVSFVTGFQPLSIKVTNRTKNTDVGETDFLGFEGGTNAGDPLPPGVALLVTFPTNQLKTRGRKFIPGLAEVQTTGGLFSGSVLTQAAAYAAAIAAGFIGGVSGVPSIFGVVDKLGMFKTFTGGIVSTVPAYQRRRKQGVGI